jgi:protein TonB
MPEAGFFAQKRNSPTSLGLVILLHAALIAAVVLIKGPAFVRMVDGPIVIRTIPIDPDPPRIPPPPQPNQPQPRQETFDHVPPLVDTHPVGPTVDTHQENVVIASNTADSGSGVIPVQPPPPPLPVRRAAQIDASSRLQPPYPSAELRAQRDGRVQVRVTIGPDGRVIDVALVSATSDAFWRVTRQQALQYWRFRPATVDGRPVQDTRTMSLVFRITDQG